VNRILLVDDEPAIRFAFSQMLNTSELSVDTATDVPEAKHFLAANQYRAVIADLRLTGGATMEGFEVIREAKRVQPECKVIVITAYGGDDIKKAVFELGADSYLEKPVSAKTVSDLLKTMQIG
jgi:DNA-binding response OmpR family regulator